MTRLCVTISFASTNLVKKSFASLASEIFLQIDTLSLNFLVYAVAKQIIFALLGIASLSLIHILCRVSILLIIFASILPIPPEVHQNCNIFCTSIFLVYI